MVVIRLTRGGAKHRPYYTIVVAERSFARDGRFIEKLGFHNPIANEKQEKTRINEERLNYWIGKGAQMSMTVRRLVRQSGIKINPEVGKN